MDGDRRELLTFPGIARIAAYVVAGVILISLARGWSELARESEITRLIAVVGPVLFALGFIGFSWRRTILDRKARTVELRGLGVPWLFARRMPLANFLGAAVRRHVSSGTSKQTSRTSWKVVLIAEGEEIEVLRRMDYNEAERDRQDLIKWLGPPFDRAGADPEARIDLALAAAGLTRVLWLAGLVAMFASPFLIVDDVRRLVELPNPGVDDYLPLLVCPAIVLVGALILQLAHRGVTIGLVSRTVALRPIGLRWFTTGDTSLDCFHTVAVRPHASTAAGQWRGELALVGSGEPFVVSETLNNESDAIKARDELAARLGPPFATTDNTR